MIHLKISKHENNIGAVYGAVPASQPSCTSMPSKQSTKCQYCSGHASPLPIFSVFFRDSPAASGGNRPYVGQPGAVLSGVHEKNARSGAIDLVKFEV